MKISLKATYNGHNAKKDGIVNFSFKAPFTEIANAIGTVKLIGKQFKLAAMLEDGTKIKLTTSANLNKMSVDSHGETTVVIETDVSFIACSFDEIRSLTSKTMDIFLIIGKSSGKEE